MPIGAYVVGLSPSGREVLNALIELKTLVLLQQKTFESTHREEQNTCNGRFN